jgi:integrase
LASGTVSKKMRANGMTWIYRFQTTRPADGARVENTRVIGLVKNIGDSAVAAWKEVGRLGLDINLEGQLGSKPTFRELAEHFRERELRKESGVGLRAPETVTTHELLLDRWILPRWGEKLASEIKSVDIEAWFESLTSNPQTKARKPLTWPTVSKMKSVMAQVFKHAQRHELIPAAINKDGRPTNPALLARCEAGSDYEAAVVTPEQMIVILKGLDKPETLLEWTLALLHAATAMRPEETFGLKWQDIDWKRGQINIRRGWSKGKETPGKNEGSMTQVAMHQALGQALMAWRRESRYNRDSDWVFASDQAKGRTPRSAGVAGQDYLRPAAVKAGVIPPDYRGRFGWHNLRHSLATFFADNEVSLAVIQKALRHAKPTTSALYIHRVGAAQVAAQGKYLKAIKLKSKRISKVA